MMFRSSKDVVLMIAVASISSFCPTKAFAFFIQFDNPSAVSDLIIIQNKTVTNEPENHRHNGGGLANGLFLGALTETSAVGTEIDQVNQLEYQDIITRNFVIRRSNDQEPLVAKTKLNASLMGTLTANPAVGGRVFANVDSLVEVLLNTTPVLTVDLPIDSSGGRNTISVNQSGMDMGSLGVDTTYTLKLTLDTGAFSAFIDTNNNGIGDATSARSNFLNSLIGIVSVESESIPEPSSTLAFLTFGTLGIVSVFKRKIK